MEMPRQPGDAPEDDAADGLLLGVVDEVDRRKRRALPLLSSHVTWAILTEVCTAGPLTVGELEGRLYPTPSRTLRDHRKHLIELGVLARRDEGGTNRHAIIEAPSRGHELDRIGLLALKRLRLRPERPIEGVCEEAAAVVAAVVDGLSTGVLHRLAREPHGPSRLQRMCGLSKSQVETVLDTLSKAGVIVSDGRGRYELTAWGRLFVVPVAASGALWDRENLPEGRAVITTEATAELLMMGLDLIQLRDDDDGACALTIEGDPDAGVAGDAVDLVVEIERGEVVSRVLGTVTNATARAAGTPDEVYRAVLERNPDLLRIEGDRELIDAIVRLLHAELVLGVGGESHGRDDCS